MTHLRPLLAVLVLTALFISCGKSNEKSASLQANQWMLGRWEWKKPEGQLVEQWEQINDSVFQGRSFYCQGKDTLHFETISLESKANQVLYIATVRGQNQEKPVSFRQTKPGVFENPKHDYPQKISYRRNAKGQMVAQISGIQNSKLSFETFTLTRKN